MALDPRVYVLTDADIGCTFKVTVTPVRSDGAKVRGVIGELLAPVLLGSVSTTQHSSTLSHASIRSPITLRLQFLLGHLLCVLCIVCYPGCAIHIKDYEARGWPRRVAVMLLRHRAMEQLRSCPSCVASFVVCSAHPLILGPFCVFIAFAFCPLLDTFSMGLFKCPPMWVELCEMPPAVPPLPRAAQVGTHCRSCCCRLPSIQVQHNGGGPLG